jgi:hypothetical protein
MEGPEWTNTMPQANPDVILYIPQTQFQAVQTRLTDFLLRSQYAFAQSFSSSLDTIFDIFLDMSPGSPLEGVQFALRQVPNGPSVTVMQDRTLGTAPQSARIVTLTERLIAVCTDHEGM